MTPSEIKQYLANGGRASVATLAVRFGAAPDAVRAALAVWVAKDKVRQVPDTDTGGGGCGGACAKGRRGCCSQPAEQREIYEWIG